MNSKLVYVSYESDMMGSLGIETYCIDPSQSLESYLVDFDARGIYIVYLSEAVYLDNQALVSNYQFKKNMNLCVMGESGKTRMNHFKQSTLGVKMKKEGSH